jgi:hypothetical protein
MIRLTLLPEVMISGYPPGMRAPPGRCARMLWKFRFLSTTLKTVVLPCVEDIVWVSFTIKCLFFRSADGLSCRVGGNGVVFVLQRVVN